MTRNEPSGSTGTPAAHGRPHELSKLALGR